MGRVGQREADAEWEACLEQVLMQFLFMLLMMLAGAFNFFGALFELDMWVYAVRDGPRSYKWRWIPMRWLRVICWTIGGILLVFGVLGVIGMGVEAVLR